MLAWLCEGLSNPEIVTSVKDVFGVTISRQAVFNYRALYAEEIDEVEEQILAIAKRAGWALRSKRITALCCKLDKLDEVLDEAPLASWGGLCREFRECLAELRKELGQEQSRPDGDVTEENVYPTGDQLAASFRSILPRRAGEAGSGPSELEEDPTSN